MKKILSILTIALVAFTALAQDTITAQQAVDRFVNDRTLRNASVGVMFMDIDSGKVIASANPDLAVITASTMKTITSLAALEALGGTFRYETHVYTTGKVVNDTLVGNIVVVGSCDPTLGTNYIDTIPKLPLEIVKALQARGIKGVKGRVITDNTLFAPPYYCEWWEVGDLAQDYGAGVFPLNYRDNTIRVNFSIRKGKIESAHFVPEIPGVGIKTRTTAGKRNYLGSTLDYGSNNLIITGSTTSTTARRSWVVANPCPDSLLIVDVREALKAAGIDLAGEDVVPASGSNHRTLLMTHYSPVLTDIVTSLLDRSDNMFTHALLRTLGIRSKDYQAKGGDVDQAGCAEVKRILGQLGIDTEPLYQLDGSGLARANKNSVAMFCNMLRTIVDRKWNGKRMVDLMPNAGRRIGKLLPETELKDSVHLKSGSMSHVQCFVGYYPADKPKVAWAMLCNNYSCSRPTLKNNIDRLLIGALLGK